MASSASRNKKKKGEMIGLPMTLSASSTNQEIADTFSLVGEILSAKGENVFRIRAYQRAAESIAYLEEPIKDIWERGEIEKVSGIGATFRDYLDELYSTGSVKHFTQIFSETPGGMLPLLRIPGVGAKTAYTLAEKFRLLHPDTAISELEEHLKYGDVEKLPGFGKKKSEQILQGIQLVQQEREVRYRLPDAESVAREVIEFLKKHPAVKDAEALGSLRRRRATVGDVDIAVLTEEPDAVMEYVATYPGLRQILATGPRMTRFLDQSRIQVDVKTHALQGWGNMLQHYTGSKQHNIALRSMVQKKGWSLSEYALKKNGDPILFDTEEQLYRELGMDYIPPELREDQGEIAAALSGKLPDLIELEDIKGDVHMHTNLNFPSSHDMGASSIAELLATAQLLGYEYIGLSDHNPKLTGLSPRERLDAVKRRNEDIDKQVATFAAEHRQAPRVFKGLEVDIRTDGTLALEDEALAELDYVIASLHSQFTMPPQEMTERVIQALSNPYVKIWGHPTGRLLEKRDGMDCDWERVFELCAQKGVVVEVNASPYRLDLPDSLVRKALEFGVKLSINTDTHHVQNMHLMRYGVAIARRGWAQKKDVANELGVEGFRKLITTQ